MFLYFACAICHFARPKVDLICREKVGVKQSIQPCASIGKMRLKPRNPLIKTPVVLNQILKNHNKMAKVTKKPLVQRITQKGSKGIIHIQTTFNNTIITVTDLNGQVISWSSSGACGFKGARKKSPFAAKTAAETAAKQSLDRGIKQVRVMVKGPGQGRETAIRALQEAGIQVTLIRDVPCIPHNGCRPAKRRRI